MGLNFTNINSAGPSSFQKQQFKAIEFSRFFNSSFSELSEDQLKGKEIQLIGDPKPVKVIGLKREREMTAANTPLGVSYNLGNSSIGNPGAKHNNIVGLIIKDSGGNTKEISFNQIHEILDKDLQQKFQMHQRCKHLGFLTPNKNTYF